MSEDTKATKREFPGEKEVDGVSIVRTVGRDFRVEGNDVDGYIGVDPEYRTYANETEKPILTEADEDKLAETGLLTDVEQMTVTWRADQVAEANRKREDEESESDEKSDDDSKSDDAGAQGDAVTADKSGQAETNTTPPVKSAPAKTTPAKTAAPKADNK